jgi:hypothetical protein
MTARPLPGDARNVRLYTRPSPEALAAFRRIAEDRAITDGALLRDLIADETGHRDTARRQAARRRHRNGPGSPVLTVNLSAREAKRALKSATRQGMNPAEWLRGLVDTFLAANGHKTAATEKAAPKPRRASSLPPLTPAAFTEDRARAAREARQAGYSLAEIGGVLGISRQRVSQIARQGEQP